MVYKHLMFELLPYGAITDIVCTSSSKKGNLILDYNSSTDYTTTVQDIGKNTGYFLLSEREPVEMTYNYTKSNGKLVEIITNLRIVSNNNIRDDGNGHYSIINEQWISSGNGSFTISSDTWFNSGKVEEPYVKLCFNEVKIECCFTNPWSGRSDAPTYSDNGWLTLANNTDANILKPVSNAAQNYCELSRYFLVSWNKEENTRLFIRQYANDGHWYQIWFSYMDKNGDIVDFNGLKTVGTDKIRVNEFLSQRVWSHTSANSDSTYSITIPRLNGEGKINNIIPYNYFKIGYTINFHGESTWQPASVLSINENNFNYDSKGFIYKQNITGNINSENSSPILYSHPSANNWSSSSRFYKTANGNFVSPSDGLQIISNWSTGSYCVPYCSCDCNYSCPDCACDCNYGGSERVYAQNRYSGGATGDVVATDQYGNYYRTGDIRFVSSGWYNVIGYCEGSPVISGPIALNFYSWDGSDY